MNSEELEDLLLTRELELEEAEQDLQWAIGDVEDAEDTVRLCESRVEDVQSELDWLDNG